MPLILQDRIYRSNLRANPDKLYVFGDNVVRKGRGGQAREMRGEQNAVGVATKKYPTMKADAFFTDDEFEENVRILDKDCRPIFEALEAGKTVIFPRDGIGTGLSGLAKHAPKTAAYLDDLIASMKAYKAGPAPTSTRPQLPRRTLLHKRLVQAAAPTPMR